MTIGPTTHHLLDAAFWLLLALNATWGFGVYGLSAIGLFKKATDRRVIHSFTESLNAPDAEPYDASNDTPRDGVRWWDYPWMEARFDRSIREPWVGATLFLFLALVWAARMR